MAGTPSVRETILEYIATRLSTITSAKFYRSREAAISRAESVAITLQPEDEPAELRTRGIDLTLRDMTVVITVLARGDVPDQIADPTIVSVHAFIMKDPTLEGRCALVREHSTRWTFEVADQTAVAAELRYVIRYQTRASDLTQAV